MVQHSLHNYIPAIASFWTWPPSGTVPTGGMHNYLGPISSIQMNVIFFSLIWLQLMSLVNEPMSLVTLKDTFSIFGTVSPHCYALAFELGMMATLSLTAFHTEYIIPDIFMGWSCAGDWQLGTLYVSPWSVVTPHDCACKLIATYSMKLDVLQLLHAASSYFVLATGAPLCLQKEPQLLSLWF